MELEAVSNSGPLIHLAQIGKFKVLNIFSKIYLPEEVYQEVNTKDEPGQKELKEAKNIQICKVSRKDVKSIEEKLTGLKVHKGELHALSLFGKL